jgi:hypothetical protein
MFSTLPALAGTTGSHPSDFVISYAGHSAPAAHETQLQANSTIWRVRVIENGLAPGTKWQATVNGTTKHTTAALNTFFVINGTYDWSVTGVGGYSLAPQSGMVTVLNANLTVTVTFTPTDGPGAAGLLSKWWWAILGAVVVLIVLVLLAVRLRRGKPAAAEWTPPADSAPPTDAAPAAEGAPPPPDASPGAHAAPAAGEDPPPPPEPESPPESSGGYLTS